VHTHTDEQYVAIDGATGETYARPPVRAQPHAHPHRHDHPHPPTGREPEK
jgi:hypothetical protein